MRGTELAWVEPRGGWDDIASLDLSMDGESLLFRGTNQTGLPLGASLSMSTPDTVKVLGNTGEHMFVFISGGSSDVLSEDAVDDLFGAPTANRDTYSLTEGESLDIDAAFGVLANDTDVDGDTLIADLLLGTAEMARFPSMTTARSCTRRTQDSKARIPSVIEPTTARRRPTWAS